MTLVDRCRSVLEDAWRPVPGFCVPNSQVYPHQWLWDSCFHSVVWSSLGDTRAVIEVESALANQTESGFVPHMTYWSEPLAATDFWGTELVSTITQPPMYGHALAVAAAAGLTVGDAVLDRAQRGIRNLLDRPRIDGRIVVIHPWETGCDDSARWDDWCPGGYDRDRWRVVKHGLVDQIGAGESSSFQVPSVGFNALVAWNAIELGVDVGSLVESVMERWSPELRTWTDSDSGSGTARTLDALLPLLIDPRGEAFDDLIDPAGYGAPFGPRGAHIDEPTYDPDVYWRGPNWPQLTYLLAVAARRAGRDDVADALMSSLQRAADASNFAEYWNPETGSGGGATPQTWTTLACVDF